MSLGSTFMAAFLERAAVLNKNVLTRASILIALCTTGSQDLDALDTWIEKHGQPEERARLMAALLSLPRWTAWVWAPEWPDERGIFREVRRGDPEAGRAPGRPQDRRRHRPGRVPAGDGRHDRAGQGGGPAGTPEAGGGPAGPTPQGRRNPRK
jgi:hypothetical protein